MNLQSEQNDLGLVCREMRKDILRMAYNCGSVGAHLGGSMSCVEILATLYCRVLKLDKTKDKRDCFIMSKAHSVMALYAALKQKGFLGQNDIDNAMKYPSFLYKHPKMNEEKGIEISGGSLGQGLSVGVGVALGYKRKTIEDLKVYVLLGDGECDEGAVWEAAALASHYKLDNLTAIVDRNHLQNDGTTAEVLNIPNMGARWEAFGFQTIEVDGHDTNEIYRACIQEQSSPRAIIADTVKGKGISYAENIVEWHAAHLTKTLFEQGMKELNHDGL